MKEEVMVQLNDDSRENTNNLMIKNVGINSFDLVTDFDFWPIQHPTEPSHEDRPVQCPMPHSSSLINVSLSPYTCFMLCLNLNLEIDYMIFNNRDHMGKGMTFKHDTNLP